MTNSSASARTPWICAIYLIVISLVWLLNASFYQVQRMSAPIIYHAGQDVLTEARKGLDYLRKNDPGDLRPHQEAYQDLQKLLLEYKVNHMDKAALLDLSVSVLAVVTALLYFCSGIGLFARRIAGAWVCVRGGMIGIALHYGLVLGDFLQTMIPINNSVNRLLDVFGVDSVGGLSGPVIWVVAGFALASGLFYVWIPALMWRRFTRKSQSLSKTSSH